VVTYGNSLWQTDQMSQGGDVERHKWYYFWLIHHTSHGRSCLLISLHCYIIPHIQKICIFC